MILFALLIIVAKNTGRAAHSLSIAGAALSFAASLSLIPLSYLEHERCRRPSVLIGGYIFLILLFDIVQTRTLWLLRSSSQGDASAQLLTVSVVLNAIVLCLESVPKTSWIDWESKEHSPEESSNIFSLGVYFWLNRLLFSGYSKVLSVDDLYPLDENIKSSSLYSQFAAKARFDTYSRDPNWALFKDVCRTLVVPLLRPIAPRVALIGFSFCQPFFLNTMLTYLSTPENSQSDNLGYGLIGASAIIFTGIALSQAFYDYYTQRFMYMARGLLASAIYNKTTTMKINSLDDSSAAITLMSTDIERIIRGVEAVHELWANLVEVAIACWLLEKRIGIAFLAPIVTILMCVGSLFFVLRLVRKRQSNWMNRIETRVGTTANAIASMKLYKMSGMAKPVASLIQGLRVDEISVGSKYRVLQIVAIIIGNVPLSASPVLTFALTSSTLNVNTLLTTVSYLTLLQPLTPMFQRLPMMLTALTCLRRIQKFLAADPRADFRLFPYDYSLDYPVEKGTGVQALSIEPPPTQISGGSDAAFTVEQSSFGWASGKMILSDINATIPARKLTLVVGPVASGKSTFCKVLLGEVPVHRGKVTAHFVRSQIGYCEQNPFLYNDTLRANITGPYMFNKEKYDSVVEATLLSEDFAQLSNGDQTKVGSNGITLSGGQKQRVSIARALYAEPPVLIFDDVLSGLDKTTETQVFNRVFGAAGCLTKRRATAVVCTHSVRHLPVADHIVAIGEDGRIVEEGLFEDLVKNGKYVHSLGVNSGTGSTESSSDSESELGERDKEASPMLQSGLVRGQRVAEVMDDRSRQTGDWSIYTHYIKSTSKLATVGLVLGGLIVGFCSSFTNVWLKFWAENSFTRPVAFYIGIYGLINGAMLLALLVNTGSALLGMITVSGTVLHHRAITTVVTAPLKFFTATDAGVITNLFSQDMTLIDSELAMALINVTLEGFTSLGMLCVIASVSPYLAIGYPLILGLVYILQKFYLRTSRQMRLLDLEAKSPL